MKIDRKESGGKGNFIHDRDGDLRPAVYLTNHAKQRINERGISQTDALKGTKKSGAVITSSGAVVTVVPEAWASANIKRVESKKNHQFGASSQDVRMQDCNKFKFGGYQVGVVISDSKIIGQIIGKNHSNIMKLKQKHSDAINHQVNGNKIVLSGPQIAVDRLADEIRRLKTKLSSDSEHEPPTNLPSGHSFKRIVVADVAKGHVIGKGGQTIRQLKEDHEASMSFDGNTGVMIIWGEVDAVNSYPGKCSYVNTIFDDLRSRLNSSSTF